MSRKENINKVINDYKMKGANGKPVKNPFSQKDLSNHSIMGNLSDPVEKEIAPLVISANKAKEKFEAIKDMPFDATRDLRKQYYNDIQEANLKLIENGDYSLYPEQIDEEDKYDDIVQNRIKEMQLLAKNVELKELSSKPDEFNNHKLLENSYYFKKELIRGFSYKEKLKEVEKLDSSISDTLEDEVKEDYLKVKEYASQFKEKHNKQLLTYINSQKYNLQRKELEEAFMKNVEKDFSKEELSIINENLGLKDIMEKNNVSMDDYLKASNEYLDKYGDDIDSFIEDTQNIKDKSKLELVVINDIEEVIDGEAEAFKKFIRKYTK